MAADPVDIDYDDMNNQVGIAVTRAPVAVETKLEQRMPCPKCSTMVSNRVRNDELRKAWFVSHKECPQCGVKLKMRVLPFRARVIIDENSTSTPSAAEFYGWCWMRADAVLTSNP